MIPLETYLSNLEKAINSNPRLLYMDKDNWLSLFRDIGYGLKDYPYEDVKGVLGSLYGRMFVKPFVRAGRKLPDINAKEMMEQIKPYLKRKDTL